ncbi:MAG: 4Fe-4S ferredoxin [Candidatus Solincola sediminis]|nr:MAG: 4Fe-4S ferredoxin [Candidatus Solincola sediminis]
MNEDVYSRLAKVLDTLPNGFPSTESGVEIKLLKKIFMPEEAGIFCDMRLKLETAEQIAERTGRPLEDFKETLQDMAEKGQIFEVRLGGTSLFKMIPWILGIFEYQVEHMDKELAELNDQYRPIYARQFFAETPQLMQTVLVEEAIPNEQEALVYEKVSSIIEAGQSFRVVDCICKKEEGLLGNPCARTVEICMAIAPVPGYFEQFSAGRIISKDEAYELLNKAEDEAMVHLASNVQTGQFYICNCCKCCCGVLRSIHELGIPASLVINSHYYAVKDPELCTDCGICAEERCQVNAIVEEDGEYQFIKEACIGCGLCVSSCPSEAIKLVRKEEAELVVPPLNEPDWFEKRGQVRGIDFTPYK